MRIATWNINSIRLRLNQVLRFMREQKIDVMCLQETKTEDQFFPIDDFIKNGISHLFFRGEKSYNGVAIISKIPIIKKSFENWCKFSDTRHLSVILDNDLSIHNFYIPAGGDIPDIKVNRKFDHKIKFLNEMKDYFKKNIPIKSILVGDLNIAPYENDVWSHNQLINVVSHTPLETNSLLELKNNSNWIDVGRKFVSKEEKLYTWWSYRNRDWKKSNRGRRLDHIWVTQDLDKKLKSYESLSEIRDWEKPSDHVPIVVELIK